MILRKLTLHLKYADINIDSKSIICKNCKIVAIVNSSLNIINSHISEGVKIMADHGGKTPIKDSFIGPYSIIVTRENIMIESNCQIAEMVVIRDQNHNFGEPNKTIVQQGFCSSPIIIQKNVWLGAKSTILMGSIIQKNSVVGAHSLVKGELDSNSVYVGTPAKKIKSF